MRIGELAARAGVSTKAVRYYEGLGLLRPARGSNGYRVYDDTDVAVVREVSGLRAVGISPRSAHVFVECLAAGHEHGDDCVSSLAVYRDQILELDRWITALTKRREELARRLEAAASRTFPQEEAMTDYTQLPTGLPVPEDDGAADHLPGTPMPAVVLPASDGRDVELADLGPGRR